MFIWQKIKIRVWGVKFPAAGRWEVLLSADDAVLHFLAEVSRRRSRCLGSSLCCGIIQLGYASLSANGYDSHQNSHEKRELVKVSLSFLWDFNARKYA
ncbi:hypothetical protein LDENG_00295540 [Lucifuga dentata]|nr:hypothetical protein LDENG_00295540 [Lucifuga dentata]